MAPPLPPIAWLPKPARMPIVPPALLFAVVSPASMLTFPPSAVLPLPTASVMDPPFPAVAAPDVTSTAPLLPALVVPDWNDSAPLTPLWPASADTSDTAPLDVAVP